MRALVGALAVALCAGCASSDQPQRYFVLEASAARAPAANPRHDGTLVVAPVTAAGFYRTRELAYSRAAGTRSYYQYASWTELPATAIGSALLTRLERNGTFRAVTAAASGAGGTLLLRVHLDDIYHDAATPPGTARIALTAQLLDAGSRTLIDKRTFTAAAPTPSYDADGAVAGLRQALDQVLDELVNWAVTPR
jgi:cholesterol transport system auxiliary component